MQNREKLKRLCMSKSISGSLMAKWLPRPNVNDQNKKRFAKALAKHLRLSPRDLRKLLVSNSETVEQLICANEWGSVDYEKVPSKAMGDLMKAFRKHDTERFEKYLESVEKGEATISAGAVYPYDIVKAMRNGDTKGANLQWDALPNYMKDCKERILPLVDVSGSMSCSAGGSKTVSCMDVAISLGLYISERNEGIFKNAFLTFSSDPTLQVVSGTLYERFTQMSRAYWCISTNIQKAFKVILDKAVQANVPQNEMPTMILILSDMEFDSADSDYKNMGAQNMISKMYQDKGYEMPKIVYWNIQSRNSNVPVQFNTIGTCLVSGFSPALMKSIASGAEMTPMSMMMDVIGADRYSAITV